LVVSSGVGVIMRSAIYGVIFTAFLASAGIVQAGVLDGKSLFCTNTSDKTHPVYGLVFEQGEVTRWQVDGFSKTKRYEGKSYTTKGTRYIQWHSSGLHYPKLDRQTLKIYSHQCSITTPTEIFQKLHEIIAVAKRTNKI
jgi:hypothetical protein